MAAILAVFAGLGVIVLLARVADDQQRLEATRREIEQSINRALPPGTDLATALDYLERNRYFPHYSHSMTLIDAVKGYDVPSYPAVVGRRIYIRGHLDHHRQITRWEVTSDKWFLPIP